MRVSQQAVEAFIVQLLANLVTAAIVGLVLAGAGLVPHNGVVAAVAIVVLAWGVYGLLFARLGLDLFANRPTNAQWSAALSVAAFVAVGSVVLEIIALRQSYDWGRTGAITTGSVVVGSLPLSSIVWYRVMRSVASRGAAQDGSTTKSL